MPPLVVDQLDEDAVRVVLRVDLVGVRRKLGAQPGEPGRIKTFQGIGYLLDVEDAVTEDAGATIG